MNARPLMVLAALASATEPDFGKDLAERLKGEIRRRHAEDPMGTTLGAVMIASLLFYRAEKDANPKVKSLSDALVHVTTNLSVGHGEIAAETEAGKAIGSALRTFGPAMAARLLDPPTATDAPTTREVVDRLERILDALESRPTVR